MKKLILGLLFLATGSVFAESRVRIELGVPLYPQAPVYVSPAPVYTPYGQQGYYSPPAQGYYSPPAQGYYSPPAYVPQPVYTTPYSNPYRYSPPPVIIYDNQPNYRHHRHHHEWERYQR